MVSDKGPCRSARRRKHRVPDGSGSGPRDREDPHLGAPRVFEHEWNVEPRKDLPTGEKTIVRWELTPEGDGTLLRFTHRRLTRQAAVVFAGGMHGFLDRLENQLDGVPLVDWGTRISEVRTNYPQWGT